MDELPRVKSVEPAKTPYGLDIVWSDGRKTRADLTGLVHRSPHFRVFLSDPDAFRKVRAVHYGTGIGWDNGLDYSASTLRILADAQRPMRGKDLSAFESRHGLHAAETAKLLGVAERTVRAYRAADVLPEAIAISLRALESDRTVFAAHYRPSMRRTRGRPKRYATSGR